MNRFLTVLLFLCITTFMLAQDSKYPAVDPSPMDFVTYPAKAAWRNYLQGDDRTINPQIRISYSRPQKNDRVIFGELIPYGSEWRVGANEATEITFYQAVGIGDDVVAPGIYTMHAMVNEDQWTISLSTERNIWGSANRDKEKDVASVTVKAKKVDDVTEALSMTFQEIDPNLVHLHVAWDQTKVAIPIALNPPVFAGIDVSPMDQSVYPARSAFTNYLKGEEKNIQQQIKVVYSRPHKKDRAIFGELVPYGEVWRVGANESTEITFYQNVKFGDKDVNRGRYALYAEVHEDHWDFILSNDLPAWGNANRDESKDVVKARASIKDAGEEIEAMSIHFEGEGSNPVLVVAWDKTRAELPISIIEP